MEACYRAGALTRFANCKAPGSVRLQIATGFGRERRFRGRNRTARTMHSLPSMIDVVLVLSAAAFFAVSWAYVRFCAGGLGGAS